MKCACCEKEHEYNNTGCNNSGDYNSGNYNSGYRNSGNYNSGYRNSGNYNSGNYNSGELPRMTMTKNYNSSKTSSTYSMSNSMSTQKRIMSIISTYLLY